MKVGENEMAGRLTYKTIKEIFVAAGQMSEHRPYKGNVKSMKVRIPTFEDLPELQGLKKCSQQKKG